MKTREEVIRTNQKDIDSFNIKYKFYVEDILLQELDGSYNVRTNFAHIDFSELDEGLMLAFGIDLNELESKIENRDIEIN